MLYNSKKLYFINPDWNKYFIGRNLELNKNQKYFIAVKIAEGLYKVPNSSIILYENEKPVPNENIISIHINKVTQLCSILTNPKKVYTTKQISIIQGNMNLAIKGYEESKTINGYKVHTSKIINDKTI